MTQTNTDYLFQVTAPTADRKPTAPSTNDGEGRFDDHLSQASTGARDGSPRFVSSSRAPEPLVRNDRRPGQDPYRHDNTKTASHPTSHNKDKPRADKVPSSQQDDSAPAANGKKGSTDKVDTHDDDTDNSDTTDTSGSGVASQTAVGTTPDAKSTSDVITAAADDSGTSSAIDATNINTAETDAPAKANPQPVVGVACGTTEQHAIDDNASIQTADVVKAAAETAVTTENAPQEAAAAAAIETKDNSAASRVADSKSTNNEQANAALQSNASDSLTGNTDVANTTAQTSTSQTQATPTPPVPSTNSGDAADRGATSHDDSHDDSQIDSRAGVSGNAIAQANKATIAAVVNTVAANAGDASANVSDKRGKNETSIKPVTAPNDLAGASLARLARSAAGADGGSQTAANGDLPSVDPARFVGRVAKAFQTAQDRGGTLQIRLSPPELGALRLELTVKDGVMNASLQTENADARRLLLDHLPALRDRLAEQNIRVDRFDVDVRRDGTGGQADARGSQQQAFQHQPDQPTPRRQPAPQPQLREAARQETTSVPPTVSDAGLNLIV